MPCVWCLVPGSYQTTRRQRPLTAPIHDRSIAENSINLILSRHLYASAEGGFGTPCKCADCIASFEAFKKELPADFLIPGKRLERGSPEVLYFHKWAFDLIYETVKAIKPDLEIVRNTWDFQSIKALRATAYAHQYTPEDVIFMPYTVSTDTNLREDPNPQITWWAKHGRRVAPKMCQLIEMHPRSNCFPNALDDRMQAFYTEWAEAGIHGVCLHGGWFPSERFSGYKAMTDNIGFGFNLYLHWKLLWNPFRKDVEDLWDKWCRGIYGAKSGSVAKRCLKRAGRIYRLGPEASVKENPTYRDYLTYTFKAGGAGGAGPCMYPFGFDVILLYDKITHQFFSHPDALHREFVYAYEDYPTFKDNLHTAYTLLDQNIDDLERALEKDSGNTKLTALLEWFSVEKKHLQGIDLLFKGEEEYLIKGEAEKSAESYSKAYTILRETLSRWGDIALEQKVWPFFMGGHFYPYRDVSLDEEWLDAGAFGTLF